MKEFGYSSAAAISLLVVSAGLSLAAVIANLPLERETVAKGSWKPGSDNPALADAGEGVPIEESFLVSFDPGAELTETSFVASTQQQSSSSASITIQDDQIAALAALSPAAGANVPLIPVQPALPAAASLLLAESKPAPLRGQVSQSLIERSEVPAAQPRSTIGLTEALIADEPAEASSSPQISLSPADPDAMHDLPEAMADPRPALQESGLERAAEISSGVPAGYVVIGSFLRPEKAAVHVLKHQDWQPTILTGKVGDKVYQRVVVGPFSESDLPAAWESIVAAGIADAWRLSVRPKTDVAVRGLDILS